MANQHGLRGSTLEAMVNMSIARYREDGLAVIQKIPTPITPITIDKSTRHITLAYFESKSTVDYIGTVQGIPVCFDAKECKTDTFPLQNIHEHQFLFMRDFEGQDGISFLLLFFTGRDELIYLPFKDLKHFWERAEKGGRRSFLYAELDKDYVVREGDGAPAHFLPLLQKDLDERE